MCVCYYAGGFFALTSLNFAAFAFIIETFIAAIAWQQTTAKHLNTASQSGCVSVFVSFILFITNHVHITANRENQAAMF